MTQVRPVRLSSGVSAHSQETFLPLGLPARTPCQPGGEQRPGLMASEPLDPAVPAAVLNFLVSYFLALPLGSFFFPPAL